MGRGARVEPLHYITLHKQIQDLSTEAARVRVGPEITPTRMKSYILRIARDLDVPVTVRRVPGGVIFWRSTEEDLQQAKDVAGRLQTTRQKPKARPRGSRPKAVH